MSFACLLMTMLCTTMSQAEEVAVIVNRAFAAHGGKEVDAAVRVLAVDSVPVSAMQSRLLLSGEAHVIDVLCTARVFVGMGTVDFDSQSRMTIRVATGRTYQLNARASVQGECTPVLE